MKTGLIFIWLLLVFTAWSDSVPPVKQKLFYLPPPVVESSGGPITHVSTITDSTASASTTFPVTVTIGSDLTDGYIVCGVGQWNASNGATITGANFDGNSMSALSSNIPDDGGSDARLFGIPVGNLAAGTYTLTVTLSASGSEVGAVVNVFNNVHQSASTGTSANNSASSTTPTVNVSSAAGEVVIDVVCANKEVFSSTWTLGAGQTRRGYAAHSASDAQAVGMSTEAGASTVTMSHTITDGWPWIIVAVPLKPANP